MRPLNRHPVWLNIRSALAGPPKWVQARRCRQPDPEKRSLPPGYLLPPGQTMADVRRMDAELLASEGIDLEDEFGAG